MISINRCYLHCTKSISVLLTESYLAWATYLIRGPSKLKVWIQAKPLYPLFMFMFEDKMLIKIFIRMAWQTSHQRSKTKEKNKWIKPHVLQISIRKPFFHTYTFFPTLTYSFLGCRSGTNTCKMNMTVSLSQGPHSSESFLKLKRGSLCGRCNNHMNLSAF